METSIGIYGDIIKHGELVPFLFPWRGGRLTTYYLSYFTDPEDIYSKYPDVRDFMPA